MSQGLSGPPAFTIGSIQVISPPVTPVFSFPRVPMQVLDRLLRKDGSSAPCSSPPPPQHSPTTHPQYSHPLPIPNASLHIPNPSLSLRIPNAPRPLPIPQAPLPIPSAPLPYSSQCSSHLPKGDTSLPHSSLQAAGGKCRCNPLGPLMRGQPQKASSLSESSVCPAFPGPIQKVSPASRAPVSHLLLPGAASSQTMVWVGAWGLCFPSSPRSAES